MEFVKIVKDDFFATKKWFVKDLEGRAWHEIGFKTKKAAVKSVEELDGMELVDGR